MRKKSEKNVAFFTDSLIQGGIEKIISNLSIYYPNHYKKKIIIFDSRKINYAYSGRIIDLNLKRPPYKNILEEMYYLVVGSYKLRKIKNNFNISVCISFKGLPNFINILSGGEWRIVSVNEHKSSGMRFKGILVIFIKYSIKLLYNKASSIVVETQACANDLKLNFGIKKKKITVIHNICQVDKIEMLAKEEISEDEKNVFEKPVIVNVGRLNRQKCQWQLIRSFNEVIKNHKNAQLVIIGDGGELYYLKKFIKAYNLYSSVHLYGFCENPYKYISRSKIFVLSSLWEGFPIALIEAMACKTPVIATDCDSGPREILDPETAMHDKANRIEMAEYGCLVPNIDGEYKDPGDALSPGEVYLARAIKIFLQNSSLRNKYAQKGYERSLDFNPSNIVPQWERMVQKMLK